MIGEVTPAVKARSARREREALHDGPASRANAHALSASGCTISAIAAAFSFVAVPSRTRPTMPWRMAASRKKF
jgi:hypothetical protein